MSEDTKKKPQPSRQHGSAGQLLVHDASMVTPDDPCKYTKSKLVVVAGDCLIRDCLARCLSRLNGHEIISLATVTELVEACPPLPTGSLILLCTLGSESSNDADLKCALLALANAQTEVPVVLLSDVDDVGRIHAAFEWGARGYIPTNLPFDVAMCALRIVEAGGTFVPASSVFEFIRAGCSVAEECNSVLTARQATIAAAIRDGKANKQIAYELNMRESTVKVHIRTIMKKLNAKNRTEVAVKTGGLHLRSQTDSQAAREERGFEVLLKRTRARGEREEGGQ